MTVRVLVLRTAGTNCEQETAYAFELVGARTDILHINRLREQPALLRDYGFLAIPGGFSYGDDIASGRIFANEIATCLESELPAFVERGGYVIGICNGFQVLVKAGLLPATDADREQRVTLADNANGAYTDRWVRLSGDPTRCAWIPDAEPFELPVAHAEGRFRADADLRAALRAEHQVAVTYAAEDNFNGSDDRVAGLCDPTGRIFGLMPHPERFLRWEHHPNWTRLPHRREGAGLRLFRAAMKHAKES